MFPTSQRSGSLFRFEIDTLADWKHTRAIEIKSGSRANDRLSANIRKYLDLLNNPKAKGAVFYLGDHVVLVFLQSANACFMNTSKKGRANNKIPVPGL